MPAKFRYSFGQRLVDRGDVAAVDDEHPGAGKPREPGAGTAAICASSQTKVIQGADQGLRPGI
jgi:hypothetical protein